MKKLNKKQLILSVVALVLVLMTTVGVTYSWIDDVKLVEFNNDNLAKNNAPLKAGVDINSTVSVTKNNAVINLGNMLKESDLTETYSTTDGSGNTVERKRTKYNLTQAEIDEINRKKGYFYESGDMHLSPCYSDGEYFFFPTNGGTFREGNKDDENVNYISFTVKVSSPDANVDFWFEDTPSISYKDANNVSQMLPQARYSISVNGKSHVYSEDGKANKIENNAVTEFDDRELAAYSYGNAKNLNDERGRNGNTIFSVKKGDTVNMTVKIWLEQESNNNSFSNIDKCDIDFRLISSWAYTREIEIVDKTTGPDGESWIGHHAAKMYLTLPSFLIEHDDSPGEWSNYDEFYPLTLKESTTDTYVATVPLVYNGEELYLYRCTDNGWHQRQPSQTQRDNGAEDAVKRSKYEVYCWNWWKTNLPNTYKKETYTLYGCSLDNSAHNAYSSVTATNQGYGTWGGVEQIKVFSHYPNTDYASKYVNNNTYKLFVRDYSDYETTNEVYTYEMYRKNNNIDEPWMVYVPKSSALIQFGYFSNSNEEQGSWGYDTWKHKCPQQRPLKNDIYASNATIYHFAGNDSNTDDKSMGRGYWESADNVYLIKNGNLWNATPYANMLDEKDSNNKVYSGNHEMTVLKSADGTRDISKGSSPVYVSADSVAHNTSVYRDVNFNNNTENNEHHWTVQTGNIPLYPGCFYDFSESKWYGSLTGVGREVHIDDSDPSGTGDDEGGGSMDGFTTLSDFYINNNNIVYKNSAGDTFKARISLQQGTNWITIQRGNDKKDYGNGKSGQVYFPGSGLTLYLSKSYNSNFGVNASSAGNYIITFSFHNGEDDILVSSILREDN